MEITSLTNAKVKQWVKYKEKKYRDQDQCFLIEGEHLIEEAHKAGLIEYLIILKGIEPLFVDYDIYEVNEEILKKVSCNLSSVQRMAVCHYKMDEEIKGEQIVMLDDVQDPGNVGTIIRSALSFGYQGLIVSDHSVDIYNEKVIRSTQGALFHIPVLRTNLIKSIQTYKEKNYEIYGTSLRNAKSLSIIQPSDKHVLIMGNEGQGVKEEILALCDDNIYIEMETFESLNVGVAASICMYVLKHKQHT